MKFAFIDAEKASFPISRMCRFLGVSQSGFFAWQERPACRRQQQDIVYLAHIRTAFAPSNGTYGSPRMHRDLVAGGHEIGRHCTARLIHDNQLIARQKRRFNRTTDSEHAWPVAPYLAAQDSTAHGHDLKWGTDISYIWTAEGWLYSPSFWTSSPVASSAGPRPRCRKGGCVRLNRKVLQSGPKALDLRLSQPD